jgi:hypothetical protein
MIIQIPRRQRPNLQPDQPINHPMRPILPHFWPHLPLLVFLHLLTAAEVVKKITAAQPHNSIEGSAKNIV